MTAKIDHPTHFAVVNGNSVFVKEAEFFKSQGGLTEPWGKKWEPVIAKSIGAARRQVAKKYGIKLSIIHMDEE